MSRLKSFVFFLLLFLIMAIAACTVGNETTDFILPTPVTAEKPENTLTFETEIETQTLIEPTPSQVTNREEGITQGESVSPTKAATLEIVPTNQLLTSMPERIVSERILDFWWENGTNLLYYTTPGHLWAYDLTDQTATELPLESPLMQTPQPDMITNIIGEVVDLVISPSGDYIIYWTSLEPTSTPTSEQGEQFLGGTESVLWVAENNNSQQIAQMPFCFTNYIWARNEQKVFLIPDPLANCTDFRVIIVDLLNKTTKSIFPIEQYPEPIIIFDISPEGSQLLYAKNSGLLGNQGFSAEILDLVSLESVSLSFSSPILRGQWVNLDSILVSYFSESVQITSLFTSSTSQEVELITTDSLNGAYIFREKLSSDLQWVAFSTGENINSVNGLWLVKFP